MLRHGVRRVPVFGAACLWLWLLPVWTLAAELQETFDQPFFTSSPEHPFRLSSKPLPGDNEPLRGKYATAQGEGINVTSGEKPDPIRILQSPCLPPGRNCTLHFDLWVANTFLKTSLLTYCTECGIPTNILEQETFSNSTSRWIRHSVPLHGTDSVFVISFVTDVSEPGSFVAIDNISMESCPTDPNACTEDEYRCEATSQCIQRDKLCDLVKDCPCGEDEEDRQCKLVNDEGRANFLDCNFTAGECFWYPAIHPAVQQGSSQWRVNTFHSYPVPRLPDPRLSGSYAVVELSTGARAAFMSHYLRSVNFPPVATASGECKVRFFYCIVSSGLLHLDLLELTKDGIAVPERLWASGIDTVRAKCSWQHAAVPLNKRKLKSYLLQFYFERGSGEENAAVSLTNITLTSACFFTQVNFSTCGASGPTGPSQEMCDEVYLPAGRVRVIEHGAWQGAQLWTVPHTSTYSLEAVGGRGGEGREPFDFLKNSAVGVLGQAELQEGDQVMIIVGQAGLDNCQTCDGAGQHSSRTPTGVNNSVDSPGSGGGGGGATFVYLVKGDKQELLLMAGGGAGLPYLTYSSSSGAENTSSEPGDEPPREWSNISSMSFNGRACPWADNVTAALGGFGGGLGACGEHGGQGGGYADRLAEQHPVQGSHGGAFVGPAVMLLHIARGGHERNGMLALQSLGEGCPCQHLCLWRSTVRADLAQCAFPRKKLPNPEVHGNSTQRNPQGEEPSNQDVHVGFAVVIALSLAFIAAAAIIAFCVIYTLRYGSVNGRLLAVRIFIMRCLRMHTQSPQPMTFLPVRVIENNPFYDLINAKITEQKLPEIPRDNLRLSEQLGQGAFGEVYKGFLSGMSGTEREVAVAVKTLPPLCSEQTELDFFTEACIISKFNHPNIVKLLGVCFDEHPRYIVLELLAGGNLKSFLQESRPSESKPSELTVGDLVRLARDIAAACSYLERSHFIHRDVAARNCLLTSRGVGRVAKLADFGMSRDVYRSDYYRKEGRALLPIKWMPPEAFTDGIFTAKTDVWSFGVVLWEIFSMGCMPYPGLNNTEVMNFLHIGGRLDSPDGCPPPLYDLMLCCWMYKAEERPNFDFIIQALSNISQDTATMLQHLPLVRLPAPCGKGLKLLNHPAPPLADDSPIHNTALDSSLEPLLKSDSILTTMKNGPGLWISLSE